MQTIETNQFNEVVNKDTLSVISFSATWCGHCRRLKPIMERVSEKFNDVSFYEVDVDDCEEIARNYQIFSIPTIICFKKGEKLDTLVGLTSFDDIVSFIEKNK